MKDASYLGDGAYVHISDEGNVVLTTGHHDPRDATNMIVLEPEVLATFMEWIARKTASKS